MGPEPFTVQVPAEVLDDLRSRLARTRWPDPLPYPGWMAGADIGYLKELVAYWASAFDRRAQEQQLNSFAQFTVGIDGQRVHFVRERGRGPDPFPLVLTHGWPSLFAELLKLAPLLTDPAAHGGDARDSFDAVIPSLPGYAFSAPRRAAVRRPGAGHRGGGQHRPRRRPPRRGGQHPPARRGRVPARRSAGFGRGPGVCGQATTVAGRRGRLRPPAGDPPADPRLRSRRLTGRAGLWPPFCRARPAGLTARTEAIYLEPHRYGTCSGWPDRMRRRRVHPAETPYRFMHTGGLPGLFGHLELRHPTGRRVTVGRLRTHPGSTLDAHLSA